MKYILVLLLLTNGCRQNDEPKYCGVYQNVYKDNVIVRQLPIKLSFHESVSRENVVATIKAIQTIERVVGKTLFNVNSDVVVGAYFINNTQDGSNVIYQIDDEWPRDEIEQAVTRQFTDYRQITEADIFLNIATYKLTDTTLSCPDKGIDAESLMLHELMHMLGFLHSSERNSVMNLMLRECAVRRTFTQTDIENLKCVY